jgi:hypothetical protein
VQIDAVDAVNTLEKDDSETSDTLYLQETAVAGIVAKKNEDIIDGNEKELEEEFAKKIDDFSDSIPDDLDFTNNLASKATNVVDDENIFSKTTGDVTSKDDTLLLNSVKATVIAVGSGIVAEKLSSELVSDDKVKHIAEEGGEITRLYRHCNLRRFRSSGRNIRRANLPSRHISRFSSSGSNNRRFRAIRKIDYKIFYR